MHGEAQEDEVKCEAQQEEAKLDEQLEEENQDAERIEAPMNAPMIYWNIWKYKGGRFELVNPNSNGPCGLRSKRKGSN